MKKFAVILSGCGVFDGTEIHEATLALLAISKVGALYEIFAPNVDQYHVINHVTGEVMPEKRNVLVESARIARGKIKSLSDFNAADFDAILFPGGFGVAKNLCDYAFNGAEYSINSEVESVIKSMHQFKKPIGAMCISPVLLAKAISGAVLTLGANGNDSINIENNGAHHKATTHGEVVIDNTNKLYTTPCYMLDACISQIAMGADNLVKAMLNDM